MTDPNKLLSPIFLEEKEIRKLMELLFFSYRDFTAGPDEILKHIHFGRVHHRIIYFVHKHKVITIKELLKILQISKQSLSRILDQLVQEKYINISVGIDKRTRSLTLTEKGIELEKQLSNMQIIKIKNTIQNADEDEINSFKKILFSMIDPEGKKIFNKLNK